MKATPAIPPTGHLMTKPGGHCFCHTGSENACGMANNLARVFQRLVMEKILMILTSHSAMENTDHRTGVWLGEFTDPYYELIDSGYAVDLASPLGGQPPVDPMSELTENITGSNRRFQDDAKAKIQFAQTLRVDQVQATDYVAVFVPGGYGPLWDLANNVIVGGLLINFIEQKKPVGAVCHGLAALLSAADKQAGLLKGVRVTGFTNTEEKLVFRADNVPYLLEDKLKAAGADFHSSAVPFLAHTEEDGFIITGQNPLSAGPTAKALVSKLRAARHANDAALIAQENIQR